MFEKVPTVVERQADWLFSTTCCTVKGVKTVTAAYAKAHLPELLDAIQNGETVTISRYNKPVADLVPSKSVERPAPKFGTGKGKVTIIDPNWARAMTNEEVDAFIAGR